MNTKAKEVPKHTNDVKSILGHTKNKDGIDHINIHSVGLTSLGRALSHFAHDPFTHPHYGPFYSIEGFWYFARSGFNESVAGKVRSLSGFRAKKFGRELPTVRCEHFKDEIIAANYQKIIQNESLRSAVIESELPFDHYYTFGNSDRHITPNSAEWLLEGFEEIRRALQNDVVPEVWLRVDKRYQDHS